MRSEELLPTREAWVSLGWLRETDLLISHHCRVEDDIGHRLKRERRDREAWVKPRYDEMRPFRCFADHVRWSDSIQWRLKREGDPVDIEAMIDGAYRRFQVTIARSDSRAVFEQFSRLGSPGYQHALMDEVLAREGCAGLNSLYIRRDGVAEVIEETEIAPSADSFLEAAAAGLRRSLGVKRAHDGRGAELLVWFADGLEEYRPDYRSLVDDAWFKTGPNNFDATYVLFGKNCVKVSNV